MLGIEYILVVRKLVKKILGYFRVKWKFKRKFILKTVNLQAKKFLKV